MKTQRNKLSTTFHTSDKAQILGFLTFMGLMANVSLDLREGLNGKYLNLNKGISESQMNFIKSRYVNKEEKVELKVFNSFRGCLITGHQLKFKMI